MRTIIAGSRDILNPLVQVMVIHDSVKFFVFEEVT